MDEFYVDGRQVTAEQFKAQQEWNHRAVRAGATRVPLCQTVRRPAVPPDPTGGWGVSHGEELRREENGRRNVAARSALEELRQPARYERLDDWWRRQVQAMSALVPARPPGGWSDCGEA